jgi:hypothetical protein
MAIQEDPDAGDYSVAVDGATTAQNGYSSEAICQIGFQLLGLSNEPHSIVVTSDAGVFDLDHFM